MSTTGNQQKAPPASEAMEAERIVRREQALDEALEESFPASDPPSALVPHRSRQ